MHVCVVCFTVKEKGTSQDNEDKETSAEKVQRKESW
jgi:hypothetical protein